MKKFRVDVDMGGISLGTESFCAHYSNGSGDGISYVYISSEQPDPVQYEFIDVVKGNFHLFNYDCLSKEQRVECIRNGNTFKLSGRYGVYRKRDCSGDMYLQRWCDAD